MLKLQRLSTTDNDFWSQLDHLLAWQTVSDETQTVRDILQNVRRNGDAALLEYTRQFDRRLQQALSDLDKTQRQALEVAAERIRAYHQHQKQDSWQYTEADGTLLGQQVMPLDKVGLYVPGGKAAYPSSVLMNALPGRLKWRESVKLSWSCPRPMMFSMRSS